MVANKLSSFFKKSLLIIVLFALFFGCKSSSPSREDLPKDIEINIEIISKKDTSTLKVKADSLYSTFNKLLEVRPSSKNLLEKLSENTGYIAETGENISKIYGLIVSLCLFVISFIIKKKLTKKADINYFSIIPFILGGLLFLWVISQSIYFVSIILELLGYTILIAPIYWWVYIQNEKWEAEKFHSKVLKTREEFDSKISKLETERLELEIKKLKSEIEEIERTKTNSPFIKRKEFDKGNKQ